MVVTLNSIRALANMKEHAALTMNTIATRIKAMTEADHIKLKPCPFCGSAAEQPKNDHSRMWVIRCGNYLCAVEVWDKNDGYYEKDFLRMIAEKWNTRDDRKPARASKNIGTGDIAGETATHLPPATEAAPVADDTCPMCGGSDDACPICDADERREHEAAPVAPGQDADWKIIENALGQELISRSSYPDDNNAKARVKNALAALDRLRNAAPVPHDAVLPTDAELHALIKIEWKKIKPSLEAQQIRSGICVSFDGPYPEWAAHYMPEYVSDLLDIAAQKGINETALSVVADVKPVEEYMKAVAELFKMRKDGPALGERQPSQDSECLAAFQRLDHTGKELRAWVQSLETASAAVPDYPQKIIDLMGEYLEGNPLLIQENAVRYALNRCVPRFLPDGFALVPITLTKKMIEDLKIATWEPQETPYAPFETIHAAIIAAAPPVPLETASAVRNRVLEEVATLADKLWSDSMNYPTSEQIRALKVKL